MAESNTFFLSPQEWQQFPEACHGCDRPAEVARQMISSLEGLPDEPGYIAREMNSAQRVLDGILPRSGSSSFNNGEVVDSDQRNEIVTVIDAFISAHNIAAVALADSLTPENVKRRREHAVSIAAVVIEACELGQISRTDGTIFTQCSQSIVPTEITDVGLRSRIRVQQHDESDTRDRLGFALNPAETIQSKIFNNINYVPFTRRSANGEKVALSVAEIFECRRDRFIKFFAELQEVQQQFRIEPWQIPLAVSRKISDYSGFETTEEMYQFYNPDRIELEEER